MRQGRRSIPKFRWRCRTLAEESWCFARGRELLSNKFTLAGNNSRHGGQMVIMRVMASVRTMVHTAGSVSPKAPAHRGTDSINPACLENIRVTKSSKHEKPSG
jgi:hypothetical protein